MAALDGSANGGSGPSASDLGSIAEHAAQFGITPERVLQEYARIAFADLRRMVDWGPEGVTAKPASALSDADAAAVSEVSPVGAATGQFRVRLYDKKAALDAVARILGMFRRHTEPKQVSGEFENGEDPREVIIRRLAALATGGAADRFDPQSLPERGD